MCKRLAGPALYSKIEQLRSRLQPNPNPNPNNNTASVQNNSTANFWFIIIITKENCSSFSKQLQFRMWMTCCSRYSLLRTTRPIPGRQFSTKMTTTLTRWIWTSSQVVVVLKAAMESFPSRRKQVPMMFILTL